MIAYGAMWAVFSATGPRIAYERAIGWTRQLRVTPLIPVAALAGSDHTCQAAPNGGSARAQVGSAPGRAAWCGTRNTGPPAMLSCEPS